MRNALYNFILNIWNRFPTRFGIFQKVKSHPILRNSTNAAIQKNINEVSKDKRLAEKLQNAKANTIIGQSWMKCPKGTRPYTRIEYHFYHDFGSGSTSGKSGRDHVHKVIDVETGLSKREINAMIRDEIRQWRGRYYEGRGGNKSSIPFTFDLVSGCR